MKPGSIWASATQVGQRHDLPELLQDDYHASSISSGRRKFAFPQNLMSNRINSVKESVADHSRHPELVVARPGPWASLALVGWCGILAGLMEVATIVLRKRFFDPNQLYGMSRQFIWLVPATNLCIFLALGVFLYPVVLVRQRRARLLAARVLCAMTILPALLVACTQIYALALFIVALGIATGMVAVVERHAGGFRRLVRMSFPVVASLVPILAGSLWGADRGKEYRERTRPMPAEGSPNVLFIVMDTVAADHLGSFGYGRPTSPTIDALAQSGIRFAKAQAASSWTLPSHASMFTGRWPHELSANWLTPLDGARPTLAEFLGARGFATAAFVANNLYCASDSGLGRGFAVYRDYIFPGLTPLKPAALVDRALAGLQEVEHFLEDWLDFDVLTPAARYVWWLLSADRKDAATVNRELLTWLSHRQQPQRPFFAFLNYYDAHYPYQLPPIGIHRFGVGPRDGRESDLIQNWWPMDKRGLVAPEVAFVRDSYDDCIAHLDEQLGRLIDELSRRTLLDQTWVIIVADHGESFGEHPGVFCHGTSLYQTELHVPLVILPPAENRFKRTIEETVSLRDLAATVVDLAGLSAKSPFPGVTLARFWDEGRLTKAGDTRAKSEALAEVVPNDPQSNPNRSRLLEQEWPLASLNESEWTYIRREGNVREELFHLREDSKETRNLAGDPTARSRLEQMRANLGRLTAGPLTPSRFHP